MAHFPVEIFIGNELSHLNMWKIVENPCNSLPDLPTNFGRSKVSRVCACKEGIFVPKNPNFQLRASPADSFSQSHSFQEGVRKTHVFQHQELVILLMLQKISDVKTNPM